MSNGNPGSGFLSAYAPWKDIARKKGIRSPPLVSYIILPYSMV
ncbi:hypothetical protein LptCag_0865 [Leptospirillum ferriphilum]|uniref:Uncharacterized protein n=1 Tax=Leptospirillum ferriphilum TaxID=178606 RepID=A0A094W940_9BACT|nr:hypothetical protein LptCag_0865 [Leptospirillum ferriphilum]